ncbi:Uncharacterised protein [Mycobacteroides abscessus subsp. massiliense]|nr:Uncharacterised protein [Mycobacteroides abscessus subsp. massiliense]
MVAVDFQEVAGLLHQIIELAPGVAGAERLVVDDVAQLVDGGGEFAQLAIVGRCGVEQ